MKKTFTERNLVVILFVMVLVTFSFAQQDSKKLEKMFLVFKTKEASPFTVAQKSTQQLQVDATPLKEKSLQAN